VPRVCTVCTNPEREGIDADLLAGRPLRDIARRVAVSKDALARHKADHLPEHLAKAKEAEEVTSASSLLEQMLDLQRRTLEILNAPESQRVAVAAVSQARQNIELLAELTGKLAVQPTINVLVSPQWVSVRAVLLEALGPFPEARAAVAGRLLALGDGRGT